MTTYIHPRMILPGWKYPWNYLIGYAETYNTFDTVDASTIVFWKTLYDVWSNDYRKIFYEVTYSKTADIPTYHLSSFVRNWTNFDKQRAESNNLEKQYLYSTEIQPPFDENFLKEIAEHNANRPPKEAFKYSPFAQTTLLAFCKLLDVLQDDLRTQDGFISIKSGGINNKHAYYQFKLSGQGITINLPIRHMSDKYVVLNTTIRNELNRSENPNYKMVYKHLLSTSHLPSLVFGDHQSLRINQESAEYWIAHDIMQAIHFRGMLRVGYEH